MAGTSTISSSAANTAAIGVRAPDSKFGTERFSEPQDKYEEKNPPTMFDRPCPMNSRLASMAWPERAATALSIEMDCARATMANVNARHSRAGSRTEERRVGKEWV